MWIFIWVVLSAFVLGIFGWSLVVLYQQKAAWKKFANTHKLNYSKGGFTESPTITGHYKGFQIALYSAPQPTTDARGQRFVTVIEIQFGPGMPPATAIAVKEYAAFLAELTMTETWAPKVSEWKDSYLVKTKDKRALRPYMTDERVKTLCRIFSMSGAIALFFFDEQEGVLRIEASDPLRDVKHMEKITQRLILEAKKLALTPEEKEYGFKPSQPLTQGIAIDDDIETDLELELEEEDEAGADSAREAEAGPEAKTPASETAPEEVALDESAEREPGDAGENDDATGSEEEAESSKAKKTKSRKKAK